MIFSKEYVLSRSHLLGAGTRHLSPEWRLPGWDWINSEYTHCLIIQEINVKQNDVESKLGGARHTDGGHCMQGMGRHSPSSQRPHRSHQERKHLEVGQLWKNCKQLQLEVVLWWAKWWWELRWLLQPQGFWFLREPHRRSLERLFVHGTERPFRCNLWDLVKDFKQIQV